MDKALKAGQKYKFVLRRACNSFLPYSCREKLEPLQHCLLSQQSKSISGTSHEDIQVSDITMHGRWRETSTRPHFVNVVSIDPATRYDFIFKEMLAALTHPRPGSRILTPNFQP